jgi:hypothetical protein
MMHELIDQNEPKCLYCNADFDTNAMSIKSSSGSSMAHLIPVKSFLTRYDIETLYCVDCKEKFQIHSNQNDEGETTYTGFTFTCNTFEVFFNYIESYFGISKNGKHIIAIPSFQADFSDKKKLLEKLKTYIVFS